MRKAPFNTRVLETWVGTALRESGIAKDLDTVFRESMEVMLVRLDEALQAGYGDFTFERGEPEHIRETNSQRFDIKLSHRGRRWGTVHAALAVEQGFHISDVEEAAAEVRQLIADIDAAT
jgi:hypothetical protein